MIPQNVFAQRMMPGNGMAPQPNPQMPVAPGQMQGRPPMYGGSPQGPIGMQPQAPPMMGGNPQMPFAPGQVPQRPPMFGANPAMGDPGMMAQNYLRQRMSM